MVISVYQIIIYCKEVIRLMQNLFYLNSRTIFEDGSDITHAHKSNRHYAYQNFTLDSVTIRLTSLGDFNKTYDNSCILITVAHGSVAY